MCGNNGKIPHLFISSEIATLVPKFSVEDLSSSRTATFFQNLQWKICYWTKHSDDDDDDDYYDDDDTIHN